MRSSSEVCFSKEEILLGYLRSFRMLPMVVAYSASSSQLPPKRLRHISLSSLRPSRVTKPGGGASEIYSLGAPALTGRVGSPFEGLRRVSGSPEIYSDGSLGVVRRFLILSRAFFWCSVRVL